MMTIRRFRTLADSYGADISRWPERARLPAQALLDSSAAAREIMGKARDLDDAIAAAAAARRESVWSGDRAEAALVRLRNGVTARISPAPALAAGGTPIPTVRRGPRRLGWFGLATAASVAILAGVVLGVLYSQGASNQELLALLQPAPIQLLTD